MKLTFEEQIKYNVGEYQKAAKGRPSNTKKVAISFKQVPKFDSKRIYQLRSQLELPQSLFATVLGVSKKTVESWEQGITCPKNNSARLMGFIEDNPKLIETIIITEQDSL